MMRYAIRKNQTGNPTLDKLVRQSPDCGGDGGYDSTETVSEGDVLDYLLVSKIPQYHKSGNMADNVYI